MRLRCVECGTTATVPDSRRGRTNYCPRCDARLPRASVGSSGAVIALVVGLVILGGLAAVGGVVAIWFLAADRPAAPVAAQNPRIDNGDPLPLPADPGVPPEFGPGPVQAQPPDPFPAAPLNPGPPQFPMRKGIGPVEPVPLVPPFPEGPPAPKPRAPARGTVKLPPAPARPPIKPTTLADRKSYPLPAAVERVIPAGGGRFLVLHFPSLRKAGVFDLSEGKIARFIDLPADKPLLAASMTKMAVYVPSAKILRRYDLLTGQQELSKVQDVPGAKALAMGSASAGPLVIATADGGRLFDLQTLTEMTLPEEVAKDQFGREEPGPRRLPFRGERLWAAANGRVFADPTGLVEFEGSSVKSRPGPGDNWPFAQPTADGRLVFRAGAGAVTVDGQKTTDVVFSTPNGGGWPGYFFLPAADGPFYFHLHFAGGPRGHEPRFQKDPERAVSVYMYGLDAPIARVMNLADMPEGHGVRNDVLPVNEQYHLIPRAKLLVAVPPGRDRLTLVPLDLDQALDEAGIDFLLVTSAPPGSFTPGREVRYPIRVKSRAGKLTYTLESGPEGMKVGPDGVVTWKVPATADMSEVSIIVGLKDGAGKEAFHIFRLAKSDTPEPFIPEPAVDPVPPTAKPIAKADVRRLPYKLPPLPAGGEILAPDLEARTELRTPDKFDSVIAGGNGRFLILHARAARKAFVYDVSTAALARTLDLGDEQAVLAAGLSQLLVYRPTDKSIEKFNLQTGASDGKKEIPTAGVTDLVVGSASNGPIHVRAANQAELYDLESLTPMAVPKTDGFPFTHGRVWASADGRVWTNTVTRATGPYLHIATLQADSVKVSSELLTASYAVPGGDGKRVYVAGYGELTAELKDSDGFGRRLEQAADPAYHMLPVPGSGHFLLLHLGAPPPPGLWVRKPANRGVSVWWREHRRAVATLEVPELTAELQTAADLPSLVHFHPETRVLVTVPADRNRLVLYPVRMEGVAPPQKKAIAWRLPELPTAPPIKPVDLKARTAFDLPGRILKGMVAGGGRYLVFQFDLRKLSVFDPIARSIVCEIATEGQILSFAAGQSKLVLVEQNSSGTALRRFDLVTGKPEASVGAGQDRPTLVMGSGSAGPILLVGYQETALYDLATLAPLRIPSNPLAALRLDNERLAASADGRTFVGTTRAGTGENAAVVLKLSADGVKHVTGASGPTLSVAASSDGERIFLGGQGVFTRDLKKAADVVWSPDSMSSASLPSHVFTPISDGPYYLHLHLGSRVREERFADDPQYGLTVYRFGDDKPKGRLPSVVGHTRSTTDWFRVLRPPGGYHLLSTAKLLVAVDPGMSRVHLIPLDPENIPVTADPDPLPPRPKKSTTATPKSAGPKTEPTTPAAPLPAGKPFRLAPLPEPLLITPVTAEKSFKLEAGPEGMSPPTVKLAGGGRFLLVQWHRNKVDVFDLNEGKTIRRLEFPEQATTLWAAGMSKLVVYDSALRGLRRFDLLSGKEDLKKEYPAAVIPRAMGSASAGPVLCDANGSLRFVDLETLELLDLTSPDLAGREYWNKTIWSSPDGRTYGVGMGRHMGVGIGPHTATVSLSVGPAGVKKAVGQFPSFYAVPDSTGRYLFAGAHGVYDLEFGKTKDAVRSEDPSPREPPIHHYLPAQDGPFYLRYHTTAMPFPGVFPGGPAGVAPGFAGRPPGFPGGQPGFPGGPVGGPPVFPAAGPAGGETGVSIYAFGQAKPIAHLKDVDPLAGRLPDPFSLARVADQVFLIPRAKALVVFHVGDFRVRVIPVDLEAEMARSGVQVPWVTSNPPRTFKVGELLRYPIQVKSRGGKLTFKLEATVPGMSLTDDGVFAFTPVADAPAEVRATIRVTDANGGQSVHSFPLTRRD